MNNWSAVKAWHVVLQYPGNIQIREVSTRGAKDIGISRVFLIRCAILLLTAAIFAMVTSL